MPTELPAPSAAEPPGPLRLDPGSDLVAYFCMEYGIDPRLHLYSGGLGVLAGDHLKAARDGGIPLLALGLFYRKGYFEQTIDAAGRQRHRYPRADPQRLPVRRVLDPGGGPLIVDVDLGVLALRVAAWEYDDADVRLLLLDTDVDGNDDEVRQLTHRLYGGDRETRLLQELVLGLGGVRAVRALGAEPTVWHINEGHAAFLVLERCREQVAEGLAFDEALELVAGSTVFTTHTPVPAGHDVFPPELAQRYLSSMARSLGVDWERLLQLGQGPRHAAGFNMTALALRGSRFHNGVSRIHHDVAAHLDNYVWPQVPPQENPIVWVTNGVHAETWIAEEWHGLLEEHVAPDWRRQLTSPQPWQRVDEIPDDRFWETRGRIKARALGNLRQATVERYRRFGLSASEIADLTRLLAADPGEVLTVGFARRFATYKRATLLLKEADRLARVLGDTRRPVVVLYAGKAHPRDEGGQEYIRRINQHSLEGPLRGHVVLLEGYDLAMAQHLLAGVDVWLNTPEAPLEASGTSGQKAAMNGVLNLSVLDGWWAEGYTGDNGWGIAPHSADADVEHRELAEAREIVQLLAERVVPAFFERDEAGLPRAWIRMAKAAMRSVIPRFNAARMLRDYVERLYAPAARHGRELAAGGATAARELAAWKAKVRGAWSDVCLRAAGGGRDRRLAPRRIIVEAGALGPEELMVECVRGRTLENRQFEIDSRTTYRCDGAGSAGRLVFELPADSVASSRRSGRGESESDGGEERVRAYPVHPRLAHRFELGRMKWLE